MLADLLEGWCGKGPVQEEYFDVTCKVWIEQ